jgi:hypothetical protein
MNDDELERALVRLTPAPAAADPVAAAYAAGRAAGRRGANRWRAACLAMVLVAVGSRFWPAPPGRIEPRRAAVVTDDRVADRPPFEMAMRPTEIILVEQAILDRGLDGLPPAPRRAVFPDRSPLF